MSDFTIRIYAVVMHNDCLLLSRERIQGNLYVKFPGGGLEYGEGPRECLRRELKEELNSESEILDHYYTTDFFQPSVFHQTPTQVLSIYYTALLKQPEAIKIINRDSDEEGVFWVQVSELSEEHVSLPIDKVVIRDFKNSELLGSD